MTRGKKSKIVEESEFHEMFRDAVNSLTEGFALFDRDLRLVMFNQPYRDMSYPIGDILKPGVTREFLIRETARQGGYVQAAGCEEEWVSQWLKNTAAFSQDLEMEKSDGTCHLVSTYPTKLGGLVVVSRNITEKKKAEAEKRDRDNLVRMVLETSPLSVTMVDFENDEIIYRSPTAREQFGDIKSAGSNYARPKDREAYLDILRVEGKVDNFKTNYVYQNGDVFPVSVSARVAEYNGKKVAITNIVDLSAEVEADALMRTVMDASSAIVTMVRMEDNKVLYRSPAAMELFGNTEVASEHYANSEQCDEYVQRVLAEGLVDDYRLELLNAKGERFYSSNSGRIAEYNGERVIVSSIVDLTEQTEADILMRTVLDASSAIITMVSIDEGKILYRTPAALKIFGNSKTAQENYVRPEERRDFVKKLKAHGQVENYEVEFKNAEGKQFPASISSRIIEYNGERVMVTTLVDLTKQSEADALIRKVMEACPVPVQMTRVDDGELLFRSSETTALFGDAESSKLYYADPGERERYIKELRKTGWVNNRKAELLNAKGKRFWGEISSRLIEFNGEEAIVSNTRDLTEHLETEELISQVLEACQVPIQMTSVATGELLFSTSETTALFGPADSSKSYYVDPEERPEFLKQLREKGCLKDRRAQYINAKGEPFWSAHSAKLIEFNGEEVVVSTTRDLTDELAIEEELNSQRELLFQNEKMSALGELLAGVAHELNNPLSIVVGHSLMLREEVEEPETVRRIEKISNAAERCAKIVKTFLAMARQQPTRMEITDINAVISTAVDVAGYGRGGDDLVIKCELDEKVPEITADADQITQVIINLIINAEQAINKAGIGDLIKVSTKISKAGKPDEAVKITVKDNGPGIPDNVRARVFEPFFTTKDVGDGTGIGLAFCHRIILSHNGQIWLDPKHKNGSKFVITLPIVAGKQADEEIAETTSRTAKKARVLVVDDEVEVAELISEILVKDGFLTDIVHSGSEAISCLGRERYDLLLSDLNMPDVDGRGLYDTLKIDFPDMVNVTGFITGDTMGSASQKLLQESKRPYLEKPVSPAELRELVYGILDDQKEEN